MGLSRLIKDNRFELVQIRNMRGNENYTGEANIFYLKKAASILELICGPEHPMIGNVYAMISFCYHDSHKMFKATLWMRKAFCIFFTTLGSQDEVTLKCFNHLLRLEGAMSSKFQFLPLEQLAMSLIDYLENDAPENSDDDEESNNKKSGLALQGLDDQMGSGPKMILNGDY